MGIHVGKEMIVINKYPDFDIVSEKFSMTDLTRYVCVGRTIYSLIRVAYMIGVNILSVGR